MTKHMTRWTAEEDAILTEMLAAGASYKEMARAIGRGVRSIDHRRKRLGINRLRTRHMATGREERAKILAWLRQDRNDDDWGDWFADKIEAAEHLK